VAKVVNQHIDYLKQKIELLPQNPGVYRFYNAKREVIYVGKAKNLKKRVSSYFTKNHGDTYKTKMLVSKIRDIEHIVVETESDSLLLENNLIKKIQPRYNILLKDDKSFPWIIIKNEAFPRVFYTRNFIKDGSEYFGPYTSVVMVKTLLELIRTLFSLRTCKLDLSEENIKSGKFKVCLEYHLGNCKGPCEGLQNETEYLEEVRMVREIVKGNLVSVKDYLKSLMKEKAAAMEFELAEKIKDKIEIITRYQSKSTIVNPKIKDLDVFSIEEYEDNYYINFIKVNKGAVIHSHNMEVVQRIEESIEDVLLVAITDIRERLNSVAKEIIVPIDLSEFELNFSALVPQRGDKLHLLQLSQRNVKQFILEKKKAKENFAKASRTEKILEQLQKDLRLQTKPYRIECFDNSNIQGTSPVAACVVFENAKPSKKKYRHYHIKTVTGADDFASMKEVVYRRYKRLVEEKDDLPNLIIIDGGKGQLNAAVESLRELNLQQEIPIIGIAKRLEEIYFPGDQFPVYIDKNSSSLKVIQNLRNEAHRFGISFHRDTRSKGMIVSELDAIKGIGDKTKELLLKEFKSVKGIQEASKEQLIDIIGRKKTEILLASFNK
jgi:excinuclease ABC subunit C